VQRQPVIEIASHTPVQRRSRVLVADDTESIRVLFRKLLATDGHEVIDVGDGEAALAAVHESHPDVVLLDITMPQLDGLEVCRRLKADPATRFTPVVLVTGLSDLHDRIKGIEAGADEFLSKPVHPLELRARVGSLTRMKHLLDALDSAEAAFMTLALTIEARDPTTNGHCERLARHAVALGKALGLDDDDLQALNRGGFLHDVGKVGVPDAVLLKQGPLTPDEFELMKRHPDIGDSLCAPLQSLRAVRPIVRFHHERLDGSGYPLGLRGEEVPLLAQIVGIADVYDALTTSRPYRRALSHQEAAHHLIEHAAAGKFLRVHVDTFLKIVGVPAGAAH
jgi:putative two-component system response regulator